MKLRKYTEDQLREAVATTYSMRQCLFQLGLAAHGGNYETVNKAIKHFKIDRSHWTGQGWRKGATKSLQRQKGVNEIFIKGILYNSSLRIRVLKESLIPYECDRCGINTWLEEPLALHLDHINGDRYDNRLENLRFLCPNCHSLTETYCKKKRC